MVVRGESFREFRSRVMRVERCSSVKISREKHGLHVGGEQEGGIMNSPVVFGLGSYMDDGSMPEVTTWQSAETINSLLPKAGVDDM